MLITNKMKKKAEDLLGNPIVTIAFLGDSVTQGCFDVYVTGPESIDTYYDVDYAWCSAEGRGCRDKIYNSYSRFLGCFKINFK